LRRRENARSPSRKLVSIAGINSRTGSASP
jgi:hypothetical protein